MDHLSRSGDIRRLPNRSTSPSTVSRHYNMPSKMQHKRRPESLQQIATLILRKGTGVRPHSVELPRRRLGSCLVRMIRRPLPTLRHKSTMFSIEADFEVGFHLMLGHGASLRRSSYLERNRSVFYILSDGTGVEAVSVKRFSPLLALIFVGLPVATLAILIKPSSAPSLDNTPINPSLTDPHIIFRYSFSTHDLSLKRHSYFCQQGETQGSPHGSA